MKQRKEVYEVPLPISAQVLRRRAKFPNLQTSDLYLYKVSVGNAYMIQFSTSNRNTGPFHSGRR